MFTISLTDTNHVSCDGLCDGSVIVTPNQGTFPYTYLWNTGQTSQSINVSPNVTTNYSVIYTVNGCFDSAAPQVSINPLPDVSFSADFIEGCAPFTTNIMHNVVVPTTSYSWDILNLGSSFILPDFNNIS